jgi:glycosyltransferase involved in cell wall biosynthesis
MSYQREPTINRIKSATRIARGSLSFTGCSKHISDKIAEYASSVPIYNFVDTNEYEYHEEVYHDAPLVFLGRIEYIKGTHNAVKVALESGRKLIIAGNIPEEGKEYFKNSIEPYIGDQIQYVGPVNDIQKNKILGQACAFLMPIEWDEPFGIVMAEALACGTPVIGFNKGSVPEVVQNGLNGFVCEDCAEMATAIGKLTPEMRKNARSTAKERFSSDVVIDQYVKLYQSLRK